jgi:hypothetical protein
MPAGGGDLQGPARDRLAADIEEVHTPREFAGGRSGDEWRECPLAIDVRDRGRQRRNRDDADPFDRGGFGGVRRGNDDLVEARLPGGEREAEDLRARAGLRHLIRASPTKSRRAAVGDARPQIWSSATTTGRSSEAPTFLNPAGARFTVTEPPGVGKPPFLNAERTRSRASRTLVSGNPTMLKQGSPAETSTSTSRTRASIPRTAAEWTRASIWPPRCEESACRGMRTTAA